MLRNMRVVLVSLGLVLGAAGCNGFLTGDKLSSNPNSPSTATIQTLFVAMQGARFAQHEAPIAMLERMQVPTCGAANGRVSALGLLAPDLVFGRLSPGAQRSAWTATAWTLKARYWLHVVTAAANGTLPGLTAPQVYDSAIAAAMNGISDPTGKHDFR